MIATSRTVPARGPINAAETGRRPSFKTGNFYLHRRRSARYLTWLHTGRYSEGHASALFAGWFYKEKD
jgi:hypothetical protein